jgi:hypothetical protein
MAWGTHVARVRAAILLVIGAGAVPAVVLTAQPAAAQNAPGVRCNQVRFAFQPDCFEPPCPPVKRLLGNRLDLGPQVAVWVEQADRSRFIDTLMVSNLTARFGVGNRPGRWDLPSGPRHPYGKRLQVLPIWAWARGRLYPRVVMQDDQEDWMGFHEQISSPDPYYCRPMALGEIDVDAITCPTKVFNSAKGKLAADMPMVPYPPRNDLTSFTSKDCDAAGGGRDCPTSSNTFGTLNDLDAVAAATPAFERIYEGMWQVSAGLADNLEYALVVEVNREFDQNASYRPKAYEDEMLTRNGFTQTGLDNNLGQPSVIYRLPFRLDGTTPVASTASIAGYGAADGTSGMVRAPDSTISQEPGSGEGRLRTVASPWADRPANPGKLFVRVDCGQSSGGGEACMPLPATPPPVTDMVVVDPAATSATIEFRHPDPGATVLVGYEIRRHPGVEATDQNFLEGVPVPRVDLGPANSMTSFQLTDLKPLTPYVVAVRVVGSCGTQSPLTQVRFTTLDQQFQQLTGCFVATAAHGSALDPAVGSLRRVRDHVRATSPLGAAAIDLYERSSPPMAAALRGSDPARALVRQLLAPVVSLSRLAEP